MSLTPVGIFIFDQVEVLDFCGPFEVFSVASKPGLESTYPENQLYQVHLIAEHKDPIRTIGGMTVTPAYSIDDHPPLEILVIPGGYGTRRIESGDGRVTGWIAEQSKRIQLLASVCTGAFLLARSGVLDGMRATTHWASIDDMISRYPDVDVLSDQRVVDLGNVITSAGISAGIDMALHVVSRQHGIEAAIQTARDMEYRWEPAA
jgi:transcriptional regulator GlxA family with amidase domain